MNWKVPRSSSSSLAGRGVFRRLFWFVTTLTLEVKQQQNCFYLLCCSHFYIFSCRSTSWWALMGELGFCVVKVNWISYMGFGLQVPLISRMRFSAFFFFLASVAFNAPRARQQQTERKEYKIDNYRQLVTSLYSFPFVHIASAHTAHQKNSEEWEFMTQNK